MLFSCCQSAKAAIDPASSFHEALEARQGNVVIATIDTAALPSSSSSNTSNKEPLGLVLKSVPHPKWQHQNNTSNSANTKPHHAIVVERIHPQSPFQNTPLREGMLLFQINHRNVENASLSQVESLLLQNSSSNNNNNAKTPLRVWAQEVPANAVTPNTMAQESSSASPSRSSPQQGGSTASSTRTATSRATASSSLGVVRVPKRTILAVAHKEEIDQTLGLTLRRSQSSGTFAVDEILPSSPFYPRDTSLLREGMIVTSINGLSITGMDMEVALSAIRDAPGSVLLAAEIPSDDNSMEEPPMIRKRIVATSCKSSPDQPVGLSLIRIPQSGSVTTCHMNKQKKQQFKTVVGRIAPNSLFRDTDLQVGFEITSVNGLDVAKSDARAILHYLQESWGQIVVLAEMDVPVVEDKTTTTTTTTTTILGNTSSSLVSHSHSTSSSMSPHYPQQQQQQQPTATPQEAIQQRHSPPHGGQQQQQQQHYRPQQATYPSSPSPPLCSSNGTTTSSSSSNNNSAAPVLLTASAVKYSPNHRLGVALNDDSLGSFFVSQISNDSPFQSTDLQVGAEVMSINGIQLSGLDMSFVSQLLRSIVGEVVLEFFLPPSSSPVLQDQQHGNTNTSITTPPSQGTVRRKEAPTARVSSSSQVGSC